jgi:hypothetical protein
MPATDSEFPTSLFRPPSARQWRREKSGSGASTHGRGRNLSWTHRARAPRSGAQDPPKETAARDVRAGTGRSPVCPGHRFRASCTARVFWEITGPGPGATDSNVPLRQNTAACWTRMQDPHVRAGEVVIRKTPGHGTIRRDQFIKSRTEQFCRTAQINLPLPARDPEIKPQHAPGFPCRPCRLHIVSCFSDFTLSVVFPSDNGCRYYCRRRRPPRHAQSPFSPADPADFTSSVVFPSMPVSTR